jgi:hypothetical protein
MKVRLSTFVIMPIVRSETDLTIDTIFTFFPRRAGRNFLDSSDVHTEIRQTLENIRIGRIQSAHDLASIIIHQCSTTFFDDTKVEDERPQLLDIFSDALSDIVSHSIHIIQDVHSIFIVIITNPVALCSKPSNFIRFGR